jgi:peptide deformylase
MLQLVTYPDSRLRKVCRSDSMIPLRQIGEMFRLMQKHAGLGLAAPQVGLDARLFITAWGEVFVNPSYTGEGACRLIQEGCLSLPGRLGVRPRYAAITMADGRRYEDEKAIVIQHETDHLNGILCIDPIRSAPT